MPYLVRQALKTDADAIARVEVASWRGAYAGLMPDAFLAALCENEKAQIWRDDIGKHEALRRKRVLIATQQQDVVGFCRFGAPSEREPLGLVYLLYVMPAHWGRGCGSVLMRAATEELGGMGMTEVTLWVLRDNVRARRFYEAAGWSPDGAVSFDDYGGVRLESCSYRKRLMPD